MLGQRQDLGSFRWTYHHFRYPGTPNHPDHVMFVITTVITTVVTGARTPLTDTSSFLAGGTPGAIRLDPTTRGPWGYTVRLPEGVALVYWILFSMGKPFQITAIEQECHGMRSGFICGGPWRGYCIVLSAQPWVPNYRYHTQHVWLMPSHILWLFKVHLMVHNKWLITNEPLVIEHV